MSLESPHHCYIYCLCSYTCIMECGIVAVFYNNLKQLPESSKNSGGGACFFSLSLAIYLCSSSKTNKLFHMFFSPAAQLQFCSLHLVYMFIITALSDITTYTMNALTKRP